MLDKVGQVALIGIIIACDNTTQRERMSTDQQSQNTNNFQPF